MIHLRTWTNGSAGCSCGDWTPPLGSSIAREFDQHLLDVARTEAVAIDLHDPAELERWLES